MPSRKQQTADISEWVLELQHPGPNCSLGYSANEVVNWDGSVQSLPAGRAYEDRSFMCTHKGTQLLMVLDGHDGTKAVKFVYTYLPHLLLTSDFSGSKERTMRNLEDAILSTEREFFIGIDPFITRKVTLQIEIEQKIPDMNSSVAMRLFPTQIAEIIRLDEMIKGGTTLVVAIINQNKLYVANLGDSRALLCIQQPLWGVDGGEIEGCMEGIVRGRDGSLVVKQLSVDHNTSNEDELNRLGRCGLDSNDLRISQRLGIYQNTRSIGDYSIKGGYRNMDMLRHAKCEPGTAEPYLHDPIDLSSCQGFLILMSDGLYEAYETWTGRPDRVNEDLAHLVANELNSCSRDVESIAQNVVDKIKSRYRSTCKMNGRSGRLDDITLIVNCFGWSDTSPSHAPQSLTRFPATPPVTSRPSEFGGHHPIPPPSFHHQPSIPPYVPYSTPPPSTSSHHPPQSSPYQQQYSFPYQPPPSSHYKHLLPSTSQYQPTHGYQADYHRTSGYNEPSLTGAVGGPGSQFYTSQHVGRPGMGPESGSYYRQDGQYDRDRQDVRRGGGDGVVLRDHKNTQPIMRVVSVPPDAGIHQYYEEKGKQFPLQYYPQYMGEFVFQPQAGQFPRASTELQGTNYQHQNPASARQVETPIPQQLQGGQDAVGVGQQYQGDTYQSTTQTRLADLNPGLAHQQGMRQPNQSQPRHDSTASNLGSRYEHSTADSSTKLTRTDPVYQGNQDLRTPQTMAKVDPQPSASILASNTSSSNHNTPMHMPSIPTESETLKEKERQNEKSPSPTNSNSNSDLNVKIPQQPEENVHESYYMVSDEEPEEETDMGEILKPYVKFNEQFPSDVSWYDIETSS